MRLHPTHLACAIALGCLIEGRAQPIPANTTVLASGLSLPLRLVITPRGNLVVTESGREPNSGRVSIVDRSGNRRSLIEGLPSGLSNPSLEPDGPSGLALQESVLYIAIGEGDVMRAGPRPGTTVPNPAGIASPLFSSVLRVRFGAEPDSFTDGFRLTREQHTMLAEGNELKLTNASGGEATVDVLANLADATPDAVSIYRHSHPFSLSLHPDHPGALFVVDAGQNAIVRIDTATGRSRVHARFAPIPNPGPAPGPPMVDAVPDGLRPYGREFLVTLLTGFPFNPGTSRVMTLDPASGATGVFIGAVSSAIDVLYRATPSGPVFYVLEFSANQSGRDVPGRLLRIDLTGGQVMIDGLTAPTALAYDESAGEIFISELTGRILKTAAQ